MSEENYNFTDQITTIVAQATIEGKAVGTAHLKEIFAPLESAVGNYKRSRFYDRMLLYSDLTNSYVSEKERKTFFDSLTGADKDMISSFIEKIYNADYDIHVHLYKFINERLMKNRELDYYDHTLFSNMEQFSSLDFEVFWYQANKIQKIFKDNERHPYTRERKVSGSKKSMDILSIKKFISSGLLEQSEIKATSNNTKNDSSYGVHTDINISLSVEPTGFIMNEYMMEIYKILDKYIHEETKKKFIEFRKYDSENIDEWIGEE